ncbi:NLRC3 [Symbiodinium natans]|uniref:NLRC3 protein n=1 Tax=Symbiodinium natans TaxID=878477 RepID=A0A812RHV4_9DINO|nr:NLRC3 [Symbiodinium natans]
MDASNSTANHVDATLHAVGLDRRSGYFILIMLAMSLVTCLLGTAILRLATCRSRLRMKREQRKEEERARALSTQFGVAVQATDQLKRQPSYREPPHPEAVSTRRRGLQVTTVFGFTAAFCFAATVTGILDDSLTKETGLSWESYTLLLCAGCSWMLLQAVVLAVTLQTGRGYSITAFAEAMFTGLCPFVSDSFDSLKDIIFGGLCLQSAHVGLHVVGWASWVYLLAFHVYLICCRSICLSDMVASHLSVFAISTTALDSDLDLAKETDVAERVRPSRPGRWESLVALLAKQLSPTRREMLLVENVPQAGLAIIYLAVEGGSLVVGLLNLAVPTMQVLSSLLLYGRLQTHLSRWYASRLDAAAEDGDQALAHRVLGELRFAHPIFLDTIASQSRFVNGGGDHLSLVCGDRIYQLCQGFLFVRSIPLNMPVTE